MVRLASSSAGVLALLLLVSLAVSSARRDTLPPRLWAEVPERVPAALPFDVFLSADEPVTYLLSYGELELEQVSQDLSVSFLALEGEEVLEVRAVDRAGNESESLHAIVGVPAVEPTLVVPDAVRAGDPIAALLRWQEGEVVITDARLSLSGGDEIARKRPGELVVIAAVPFTASGSWQVDASLVDEFGRVFEESRQIRVEASVQPVQELNVPSTTLSVITPQGRELEANALAGAYARAEPEQLWSEAFLLPIQGQSTSGFALPRRYAPGGPVSFHEGSDIAAPTGTPVLATNEGIVRLADQYPIKGGLVFIDHGLGVASLYFHLSRVLVEPGDRVTRGQIIGEVGSTGLSTGPHLHWEMRIAGQPTNPLAWVDAIWPSHSSN